MRGAPYGCRAGVTGCGRGARRHQGSARNQQAKTEGQAGAKRNNHLKNPSNISDSVLRCIINIQ